MTRSARPSGRAAPLVAGAAALTTLGAPAAPAAAATVEFLAGPLSLLAGQVDEVAIHDPNIFPCPAVGVQILAGTSTGRAAFALAPGVDTIGSPASVPARRGQVVGFQNPDLLSGERRVVQARVRCSCNADAATLRTGLSVTFVVRDRASGRTEAVVPGVAR